MASIWGPGWVAQRDCRKLYKLTPTTLLRAVEAGQLSRVKMADNLYYYQKKEIELFARGHFYRGEGRAETIEQREARAEARASRAVQRPQRVRTALEERDYQVGQERQFLYSLIEAGLKVKVTVSTRYYGTNSLTVLPQARRYYAFGKNYIGLPVR